MNGLYIVGTPIGNRADMPPRAVDTLRAVDQILAQDTRRTRPLLSAFDIKKPLRSCHGFNEAAISGNLLKRLRGGESMALVTDSGMPAVSDPGARLVTACRQAGIPVHVVPGPSAVTAAVAASGFGGHGFVFAGFAPRKIGARQRCLESWADAALPLVFFESPHRLCRFLKDVDTVLGDRELYIGRELTKKFEQHYWGCASYLLQHFEDHLPRGEFVVVVATSGAGSALRHDSAPLSPV